MGKKIKHTGVRCDTCGEGLFSYMKHDFRYCGCKSVFVDGGFDCLRVGASGPHTYIEYTFDEDEIKKGRDLANKFKNLEVNYTVVKGEKHEQDISVN